MKKIIYYFGFLGLLFIISILPTSAKEITVCNRTLEDLKVRDSLVHDNNKGDILRTPCVDSQEKVYDFADLFSDFEETEIYDLIKSYHEKTNYELVVVTINENPKTTVAYADDFYDYNYFGYNETRDGLLFLIDMANREIYISTTGYAIKMYDDERIDEIIDAGYSNLRNEDYFGAISEMISETNYYFTEGFPESNANLIIKDNGDAYYFKRIPYTIIFVIASLVTVIVATIFYRKTKLEIKTPSVVSYLKAKNITLETDTLVNTVITHVPIHVSSSSSGGRSGGGSSIHTGSSGASHGGGGRHF